jgi:hypothetical protein
MTAAEHARQKAWVVAREMMEPSQTERHGSYARRVKALPAVVPAPVDVPLHAFVMPVVTERLL